MDGGDDERRNGHRSDDADRADDTLEKWYGKGASGRVEKFDDIPKALRGNVDVVDEPLTRHPGQAPAWNARDIDDIVAFLNTLTDTDTKGSTSQELR